MNQNLRVKALELAAAEAGLSDGSDPVRVTRRAAAYLAFLEASPAIAAEPAPEDDIVIRVGAAAEPETAPPQFQRGDIVQCVSPSSFDQINHKPQYGVVGEFYVVESHCSGSDTVRLKEQSFGAIVDRFRLVARAAEGWNIWNGGERPVPADAQVEAILRNGVRRNMPAYWEHRADDPEYDIVAYRVEVQPKAAEPEPASDTPCTPCTFKPGDRVRCVNTDGTMGFKVGELYTVVSLDSDNDWDGKFTLVYTKEVIGYGMFSSRFVLADAEAPAERALQPGDRVKHDGDLYEIVAGPRMWKGREEIAVWSDDSGYSQLDVADVERVS